MPAALGGTEGDLSTENLARVIWGSAESIRAVIGAIDGALTADMREGIALRLNGTTPTAGIGSDSRRKLLNDVWRPLAAALVDLAGAITALEKLEIDVRGEE